MKRVVMIAGPNGAGKTTFATEYLPHEADCPPFVNADLIAGGLDPLGTPLSAGAGRLMLQRLEDLATGGQSFAFETTLAGRAPLRWIRSWRRQGYRVILFYLRLSSVDLAIARVRARVELGGHDVPEPAIRRRFARSWSNFTDLYRPLAERWAIYDNSGPRPILIEEGTGPDPSPSPSSDAV